MKIPLLFAVAILAVSALAFTSGCGTFKLAKPTQAQVAQGVTTAVGVADLALQTYVAVEQAKSTGKVSPTQIATLAQNDVSGIANLAQAYVGSTPAQANIAQGAANPAVGAAVQQALPQTPITQTTVNTLFQAAAQMPAVAGN
jgi:heptaprenylglyceryl phosphate synthase